MDRSQEALLKDLWATYDMQIIAMQSAIKDNKLLTASLHERMAKQLLEAYFELLEKTLV